MTNGVGSKARSLLRWKRGARGRECRVRASGGGLCGPLTVRLKATEGKTALRTGWTSEFYALLEMDAPSQEQYRAPRKKTSAGGLAPRGARFPQEILQAESYDLPGSR